MAHHPICLGIEEASQCTWVQAQEQALRPSYSLQSHFPSNPRLDGGSDSTPARRSSGKSEALEDLGIQTKGWTPGIGEDRSCLRLGDRESVVRIHDPVPTISESDDDRIRRVWGNEIFPGDFNTSEPQDEGYTRTPEFDRPYPNEENRDIGHGQGERESFNNPDHQCPGGRGGDLVVKQNKSDARRDAEKYPPECGSPPGRRNHFSSWRQRCDLLPLRLCRRFTTDVLVD